jgi:hypothetical protein
MGKMMSDKEILALAKELGWNMEHETTNRKLIEFALAILAYRGLTRKLDMS